MSTQANYWREAVRGFAQIRKPSRSFRTGVLVENESFRKLIEFELDRFSRDRSRFRPRRCVSIPAFGAMNDARYDRPCTNHSPPAFGRSVALGMSSTSVIVKVVVSDFVRHCLRQKPAAQGLSGVSHPPRLPPRASLWKDYILTVFESLICALVPSDPEPDFAIAEFG